VNAIDVVARRNEFQATINAGNLNRRPWFLYSGIEDRNIHLEYLRSLKVKLGLEDGMSSMDDVLPLDTNQETPQAVKYKAEYQDYNSKKYTGAEDYYWAANSKAYGQAIAGDIYVAIPGGKTVNQPYPNKGSNWWTYELPELTRNPNVRSIKVSPVVYEDGTTYMEAEEYIHYGSEVEIWRQGDDPIGFPADELHKLQRPDEKWTELPEVDIPEPQN
jgi:hypothetical protein